MDISKCSECGVNLTAEQAKGDFCLFCGTILPHAAKALEAEAIARGQAKGTAAAKTLAPEGPTVTIISNKDVRVVPRDSPELQRKLSVVSDALRAHNEQQRKAGWLAVLIVVVTVGVVAASFFVTYIASQPKPSPPRAVEVPPPRPRAVVVPPEPEDEPKARGRAGAEANAAAALAANSASCTAATAKALWWGRCRSERAQGLGRRENW